MNKKKLFSLAVVMIMVAILSMSSLAWFSDSDSVKNEFMIANSDDTDPDDIFSVDVWENTPDGKKEDGYTYKDILPGDVLKKEAMVENTGYYDQYIRVTVTVSDAEAWMAVLGTGKLPALDEIVNGWDAEYLWTLDSAEVVNDSIVYTMYYKGILKADQKAVVFTDVKIPTSMTVEQAAAFETNFQITVKAEAIQTENLGIDATAPNAAQLAFAVVERN